MRPPILWIAVGFGAGLWAALRGLAGIETAVPLLVGTAVLARRAPAAGALAVAAVAGMLWGAAALRERRATCAGQWSAPGPGPGGGLSRAAVVRLRDPAPASGGVPDADVVAGPCGGTLRLRWPEGRPARGGTTWLVAGRWLPRGDGGVLAARRVRALDLEPRGRGALRDRIASRAVELFGTRAPLVDALVIARRAELDAATRERYTRSGLAHLLSISGLHVAFLAGWLAVLLGLLRLRRRIRLVVSSLCIFAYVWLLGFPAPAMRAAVMLAVDAAARLRERVAAPRGSIGLAALVVLIVDPWAVRSVGAWLSVTAVAAVIWACRATERSPWAVRLVAPAAAATLLTGPITAYAFGTVAPVGVLANLVAIPLAGVAVPGLILALVGSWLVPWLGALLAAGAGLALALVDLVAAVAARVPAGHVVSAPGWPAALVWTAVAGVAWWLWRGPRRRWLVAARIAFLATILVSTSLLDAVSLDDCRCLTVHFLDVGQGDAALLRTPAGRWIVIDGGPRGDEYDAGRRVVVPFLRRRGAAGVVLVVASHGDADHLGGLPALIETFPPALVLEPGEPLGRPLYLEFLAAVEASGAAWRPARAGDRVELDGVVLEALSPDSAWLAQPVDANEHSVVLVVRFGAARLLFVGDAGIPLEARLTGRVGRVDLLKVGHHGSRTATSDEWLDELRPARAVISVGARNRYGHPAPEVLERLAERGIAVYRTDRAGTITFTFDGRRAHTDFGHHD